MPKRSPFDRDAFREISEVDPDWRHAEVARGSAIQPNNPLISTPLGDPTRWGSRVSVHVPNATPVYSDQIINVATKDPYARNWTINGIVGAKPADFAEPTFIPMLEVTLGEGQSVIIVQFALNALIALSDPYYITNDGVAFDGTTRYRPFTISGGVVGHIVNVRARFAIHQASTPTDFSIAAIIAPLAAGSGI